MTIFEQLRVRYPAPEWAIFFEVANGPGSHLRRYADAIAISLFPSRGLDVHGFEVKTRRGDWLKELKSPAKAEEIASYCVGVDTRILSKDLRWVRAGDILIGDELIGFDEMPPSFRKTRQWRPSFVADVRIEKRPVFKIVMASGTTLWCTPDHRWIAATAPIGHWDPVSWMTTQGIYDRMHHGRRDGRRVFFPRYVQPWENRIDYAAGFLAGAFDGEGCLPVPTTNWRLSFAQCHNAMLEAVKRFLSVCNFKYGVVDRNPRAKNKIASVNIEGGFNEIVRFLGQNRPPRLLSNWSKHYDQYPRGMRAVSRDKVVEVEPDGERDVAVIQTSTRTFVAEGYGSHNCDFWWVVAGDETVIQKAEVPKNWGLLVSRNGALRQVKHAERLKPKPLDRKFVAAILRRADEWTTEQLEDDKRVVKAREEGRKEGLEEAVRNRAYEAEDYKKLQARVEEFEKRSGVEIDNWNHGIVGDAVKVFLHSQKHDSLEELESVAKFMEQTAASVRDRIKVVEIARKALPEAAQVSEEVSGA